MASTRVVAVDIERLQSLADSLRFFAQDLLDFSFQMHRLERQCQLCWQGDSSLLFQARLYALSFTLRQQAITMDDLARRLYAKILEWLVVGSDLG